MAAKATNRQREFIINKMKIVPIILSQLKLRLNEVISFVKEVSKEKRKNSGQDGDTTGKPMCELLELGKEVEGIKMITEMTNFEETQREEKLMKI